MLLADKVYSLKACLCLLGAAKYMEKWTSISINPHIVFVHRQGLQCKRERHLVLRAIHLLCCQSEIDSFLICIFLKISQMA